MASTPPPTFSSLGNEYPVCQAVNWNNYTISSDDSLVASAHVAFSTISAVCCLVVLFTAVRFKSLRRFPANMLLWKTVCDLITSVVIVGINISLLRRGDADPLEYGAKLCSDGLLAGVVRARPRAPCTRPSSPQRPLA